MTAPSLPTPQPFSSEEEFSTQSVSRGARPGRPKGLSGDNGYSPLTYKPKYPGNRIQTLRDSHHRVLRFAAAGHTPLEIAGKTGYTSTRVSQIINSPSAQDQILKYRDMITEVWLDDVAEDQRAMGRIHRMANRLIEDKLEDHLDDPDANPIRLETALKIRDSMADRIGYHRKTATENVNVNFAANLEKIRAARRKADEVVGGITIEATLAKPK